VSSRSHAAEELLLSRGSGSLLNISIYGATELLLSRGSGSLINISIYGATELLLSSSSRAVSSRSQRAEDLLLRRVQDLCKYKESWT
jgi:hypothetical protein